ncbi:unnamed protein product, partial [Tuber aestivum]
PQPTSHASSVSTTLVPLRLRCVSTAPQEQSFCSTNPTTRKYYLLRYYEKISSNRDHTDRRILKSWLGCLHRAEIWDFSREIFANPFILLWGSRSWEDDSQGRLASLYCYSTLRGSPVFTLTYSWKEQSTTKQRPGVFRSEIS